VKIRKKFVLECTRRESDILYNLKKEGGVIYCGKNPNKRASVFFEMILFRGKSAIPVIITQRKEIKRGARVVIQYIQSHKNQNGIKAG